MTRRENHRLWEGTLYAGPDARERSSNAACVACSFAVTFELVRHGIRVTVPEQDPEFGGLPAALRQWRPDREVLPPLVHERCPCEATHQGVGQFGLGAVAAHAHRHVLRNDVFRLSSSVDLLRFSTLPFPDCIQIRLLALLTRRVKDGLTLEDRTGADWLREMGGERVHRVVWEQMLQGIFGYLAEEIAAVWFWNKLKLRGGSRGKVGAEQLAYHKGGFAEIPSDRYSRPIFVFGR